MIALQSGRAVFKLDRVPTAPTVISCYALFDRVFTACGFTDLTDGMYEGDPTRQLRGGPGPPGGGAAQQGRRTRRELGFSISAAATDGFSARRRPAARGRGGSPFRRSRCGTTREPGSRPTCRTTGISVLAGTASSMRSSPTGRSNTSCSPPMRRPGATMTSTAICSRPSTACSIRTRQAHGS